MEKYIITSLKILDDCDKRKKPESENNGKSIMVNVISFADYQAQGGKDKEGELYLDETIAEKHGLTKSRIINA